MSDRYSYSSGSVLENEFPQFNSGISSPTESDISGTISQESDLDSPRSVRVRSRNMLQSFSNNIVVENKFRDMDDSNS